MEIGKHKRCLHVFVWSMPDELTRYHTLIIFSRMCLDYWCALLWRNRGTRMPLMQSLDHSTRACPSIHAARRNSVLRTSWRWESILQTVKHHIPIQAAMAGWISLPACPINVCTWYHMMSHRNLSKSLICTSYCLNSAKIFVSYLCRRWTRIWTKTIN